jgi:hypothetical protein
VPLDPAAFGKALGKTGSPVNADHHNGRAPPPLALPPPFALPPPLALLPPLFRST